MEGSPTHTEDEADLRNTPKIFDDKHNQYGQDYEELKNYHLSEGTLFCDPIFKPDLLSIGSTDQTTEDIVWKRPAEMQNFEGEALFLKDGFSRFDVKQGHLGNCWMVSALSSLAMRPKNAEKVVPKNQSFQQDYAGIFVFRFWQFGQWVNVVVDDLLPTVNDELIYVTSTASNEFWASLAEKAYAKLHGGYEKLEWGYFAEALVDFTGGYSFYFDLKNLTAEKDLFEWMVNFQKKRAHMGCTVYQTEERRRASWRTGLPSGHAYAITQVVNRAFQEEDESTQLVRVRNPWGNEHEWKNAWSDGSQEWENVSHEDQEALEVRSEPDGEFWMLFQDFCQNFDDIHVCRISKLTCYAEFHERLGHSTNHRPVKTLRRELTVEKSCHRGQYKITPMLKNHNGEFYIRFFADKHIEVE